MAVLLGLTITGGTVSNIPTLRKRTNDVLAELAVFDPEIKLIESTRNGRKGLIEICAALSDAFGRAYVVENPALTQDAFDLWSKAADEVIHG